MTGAVAAQGVVPTKLLGQPLRYMTDGNVSGCGLRVLGGQPTRGTRLWRWFDVSVNMFSDGTGAVKITSQDLNAADVEKGRTGPPKLVPIRSGWLKAPGQPATIPLDGKQRTAADGVSLLYPAEPERVFAVILGAAFGDTISVGLRRPTDTNETIYTGKVELSAQESDELAQCIKELVREPPGKK